MIFDFIKEMSNRFDNISFSYSKTLNALRLHISKDNKMLLYHISLIIFNKMDNENFAKIIEYWDKTIRDDFKKKFNSIYMERGML